MRSDSNLDQTFGLSNEVFEPTMHLRWLDPNPVGTVADPKPHRLQQLWIGNKGTHRWVGIKVVKCQ